MKVKLNREQPTSAPKKDKPRGLNDFMREIEEYNRSHGTHLTYGQYTALTNK